MPQLKNIVPRYRKHRASGQAIVTLNGRDHYLGPHGTKVSKTEYDRLIAEWLQRGRTEEVEAESITVTELILKFYRWGKVHYRRNGKQTGTLDNHKLAFRVLRKYYGRKLVCEFGPKKLKTLQGMLIDSRLARRTINDRIQAIKLLFRWGVSEQLVPETVSRAISTVRGLERDRTGARETAPVKPVDDTVIELTLKHLPPVVADMVRFQRLTGCRPSEVCLMRPCDIDRTGEVWLYRPEEHKTEHHDRQRVIPIGPQAQAVLLRYLARDAKSYCFNPKDSETKRRAARHERRVIPIGYGNRPGTNKKRKPQWKPGECYTADSYRRAIHRVCEKHKIEKWAPNRIRHTTGTAVRKLFGLEAAQVLLGHSKADTTQIYAERDLAKAVEVARQVG